MKISKLEKSLGIEVYATHSKGVGGVIRQFCEDFQVQEILVNGSKAELSFSFGDVKIPVSHPHQMGSHLLCLLIKRNWDTFQLLESLARQLSISPKKIQIAGIKDAKAVTAQHITIEGVKPEDVKGVRIKDAEIQPISYFRGRLSAYFLLGNSFKITIRSLSQSKAFIRRSITDTVQELEAVGGLPNFFGHQRFGTIRPITHLVGKALVKGDFRKAAMLFLAKAFPNEHLESKQAREELYKTQDFKQALKSFPKSLYYERLMLLHLTKNPEDYIGAFRRLPSRLRVLFPQAYQAYLFNRFLSRRIALGLPLNKVEIGDYAVKLDSSGLPTMDGCIVDEATLHEIRREMTSGRMCLAIPLVGFRRHLSGGIQGEIEKFILEEEGVALEGFKVKGMPELSLKGGMRIALTPLKDFEIEEISKDQANPFKNRVKLNFTLRRGAYATVFLRELMKPRNPIKAGF
ncbi:MAG: tRNA pseudouridine(13) synthase TruD [Candidatus Bathyarchaeia archaeon]